MPDYQSAVKILDELLLELMTKGTDIPPHVADDLRSARSMANIYGRQPDDDEIANKTMRLIETVEMNLLSLTDAYLGKEVSEAWQNKLNTAYQEQARPVRPAPVSRLASGVPRGDHWIRFQSDYLESIDGAMELLESYKLSVAGQEDGYMLIYGRKEDISAFLGQIRSKLKKDEA